MFLAEKCLSGFFIWSLDQDSDNFDAMSRFIGDYSNPQLHGGNSRSNQLSSLSQELEAFTGQNCFITPRCTDGTEQELGPEQVCPEGHQSVSTAHSPKQHLNHPLHGNFKEGWYRHICCPREAMPKNCQWSGEQDASSCHGQCGSDQFELNTDSHKDASGRHSCLHCSRSLCCDSSAINFGCHWIPFQGPLAEDVSPVCPDGYRYQTFRLDGPDTRSRPAGEDPRPIQANTFKSALCCPNAQRPFECEWSIEPSSGPQTVEDKAQLCLPRAFPDGTVEMAKARRPPGWPELNQGVSGSSCGSATTESGRDLRFSYCCSTSKLHSGTPPVDPGKLWKLDKSRPAEESDILWAYTTQDSSDGQGRNETDDTDEDTFGRDAFGFVMLDGPLGSIDHSFADTHTIVRKQRHVP